MTKHKIIYECFPFHFLMNFRYSSQSTIILGLNCHSSSQKLGRISKKKLSHYIFLIDLLIEEYSLFHQKYGKFDPISNENQQIKFKNLVIIKVYL